MRHDHDRTSPHQPTDDETFSILISGQGDGGGHPRFPRTDRVRARFIPIIRTYLRKPIAAQQASHGSARPFGAPLHAGASL